MWSPRILGILVALFLGLFALDAWDEGLPAFVLHTMPAFVLLLVVAVSWHRQWVGGAVFILLALFYAARAWGRPDWIVAISGPLLVVGVLFVWSWLRRR